MILGLWVIIGLFFWMCAEVTILLFSNKELVLSWFDRKEGEDITSESMIERKVKILLPNQENIISER
jgi:hypothetical protein